MFVVEITRAFITASMCDISLSKELRQDMSADFNYIYILKYCCTNQVLNLPVIKNNRNIFRP